ncbi:hypothetical protein [Thermus albus]|uniref:hypothetical protein n=1 Tax=Thermus albus TaxID=2908146 RepID=UPI001FA96800|nr:hypothetical protein [Thermus albus]
MKRIMGLLVATALALAASTGGLKVSSVFPPRALPAGTALVLEDAKGQALWQTGKGMLPTAEELNKAAYVVFALPKGLSYRYAIVGKASSLEGLRVRIGKNTYALSTLLKNRHVAIGKDGRLEAVKASAPMAHGGAHVSTAAPKKP